MSQTIKDREKALYAKVLAHWEGLLNSGSWLTRKDLFNGTPKQFLEECLTFTSPITYADLDPMEFAWARLEKDVFPGLLASGRYAELGAGPEWKIRRLHRVDTVAADVKPIKECNGDEKRIQPMGKGVGFFDDEPLEDKPKDPRPATPPARCPQSAAGLIEKSKPFDWNADVFHEVARLFPAPPEPQYREMKEDIRKHGQLHPILMIDGQVADGRGRYRACLELGIQPKVVEWDGKGSLVALIKSLNFHRRHLTESQAALVAAKMLPLLQKEAKVRMLAGKAPDPGANLQQGRSCVLAGKEMGVSARSVASAKKVLGIGSPELVQAVEQGKVKVSAAEKMARLPRAEQKAVLQHGAKAAQAKAKQLRSSAKKPVVIPLREREHLTLARNLDDAYEIVQLLYEFYGHSVSMDIRDELIKLFDALTARQPAKSIAE